jgi:hypothetical protein
VTPDLQILYTAPGDYSINGLGSPMDITKLTPSDGDIVNNSNATLSCGSGPVIYNAAANEWKNLFSGSTYVALPIPDQFWYDASQLSGYYTNGESMPSWPDLSIQQAPLAQATSGDQPTYETNILNSLPVVRFNGTTSSMISPFSAAVATMYVVVVPRSSTPVVCVVGTIGYIIYASTFWTLYSGANLTTAVPPVSGTGYIIEAQTAGGSSLINVVNADVSGNAGINYQGALAVGNVPGVGYGQVDIAEVRGYTAAHNSTVRGQIRAALSSKWGIA